ncbi:hypothetical protein Pelo_18596 [Pelomyxa schiedti]|nr:hypothetical protein Pelo_18596 [Pelomyxa schiedti]
MVINVFFLFLYPFLHLNHSNSQSYFGVIFHVITEQWTPLEFLAGVQVTTDSTADSYAAYIASLCNIWSSLKIFAFNCDGGSNVKATAQQLRFMQIPCGCHLLQLTVKALLEKQIVAPLLQKVKQTTHHFQSSNKAAQTLYNHQITAKHKQLKVVNNNLTRWNSTYKMLLRLQEIAQDVNAVLRAEGLFHLTLSDTSLSQMSELLQCLHPFYVVTQRLEAADATISCILPLFRGIERTLSQLQGSSTSAAMTQYLTVLSEDFSPRWRQAYHAENVHNLLVVATFLDPRYKDRCFTPAERAECNDKLATVAHVGLTEPPILPASQQVYKQISDSIDWFSNQPTDDELTRYQRVNDVPLTMSPIKWWHQHHQDFPKLGSLAHTFSCVRASTAAIERVWSQAGLLCCKLRSQLHPHTLEQMLMTGFNAKALHNMATFNKE